MDVWNTVYKLRRAHFNKKLCNQAADIIENLAYDTDYRVELYKDAKAEARAILDELTKTREELENARKYIHDHF